MKPIAALLLATLAAACGGSSNPTPPSTNKKVLQSTAAVPDGPGTIVDATFRAASLGVDKRYVAYLPAGYDAGDRRYPVIYMLHGLGGDEDNWVEGGKLTETADALKLQAIVIMPDGDTGFYANSATAADRAACLTEAPTFSPDADPATFCVEHARYEDYITKDLIAHVDATYRTVPDRGARGIGGLSMGGFGALILGMRHTNLYGSVASHSGVDALLYASPHPYDADEVVLVTDPATWGRQVGPIGELVRGIFGPDLADWRAHDPATLAVALKNREIALYLDCGTEDEFQLQDGAQYLHDILLERGVEHEWYLGPGKHDFAFWADRLDDSLRFHVKAFAAATPR